MGIIIEHRNVKEVCETERIDAVVRPSFKCEPPCITAAKNTDPYRFVISAYNSDFTDKEDLPELWSSYYDPIQLAKEKGLKRIVFPLIGSSCEECSIEDILKMALRGIRDGIEGSDIEVTLALDYTARKRLGELYDSHFPKIEKEVLQENRTTYLDGNNLSPHFEFAMQRREFVPGDWYVPKGVKIPEAIRRAPKVTSMEAIGAKLWDCLEKHGYKTTAQVRDDMVPVFGEKSKICYNILNNNRQGNVTQRSVVAIAIQCGLSLEETEGVLKAGRMGFMENQEDMIYQHVLEQDPENVDRMDLCDALLINCAIKPFTNTYSVEDEYADLQDPGSHPRE